MRYKYFCCDCCQNLAEHLVVGAPHAEARVPEEDVLQRHGVPHAAEVDAGEVVLALGLDLQYSTVQYSTVALGLDLCTVQYSTVQ